MTEPMPPIEQKTPTERKDQVAREGLLNPISDGVTSAQVYLPRITIKYCTQCKWMLRAAYFAQELLSTFNTSLGEVALIPTTGGVFTVTILHPSNVDFSTQETLLWDRKAMGGFPEIKNLKSLVRNVVDPSRDLGHVDRALGKETKASDTTPAPAVTATAPSTTDRTSTSGFGPGAAPTTSNANERSSSIGPVSPSSKTVAEDVGTKPGMGTPAGTTERCGSAGGGKEKEGREECEDCQ